jgi:hypothetical protein
LKRVVVQKSIVEFYDVEENISEQELIELVSKSNGKIQLIQSMQVVKQSLIPETIIEEIDVPLLQE